MIPRTVVQEDDTTLVCYDCIGDPFLAEEVKENGTRGQCDYCSGKCEVLKLDEIADLVHEVLQKYFYLTSSEPNVYEYIFAKEGLWERSGYPVADVIADIAGLSEEIAGDVKTLLSQHFGYSAIKEGEDDPYSSDALYEERGSDDWNFRETWSDFRNDIQSRARFFSSYAEEALGDIFSDLATQRAFGDRPVICEIGPDDEDRFVWRARKAQSDKELKAILKSPVREIGPPLSRLAKGGRMNAPGISVFYGAMDEPTCIAEARAPVGSSVVVAKFELLRSVRLLNFNALTEIYVEGSYFEPGYDVRQGRAAFLGRLVREISRPVMPQDEAFEYLATQAVAEYLANKSNPRFDGIIFPSSQTGSTGRNLVLFNHACNVEPYDLPKRTEVKFIIPNTDDNERESSSIDVFEIVPPNLPEKESSTEACESLAEPMDAFCAAPSWNEYESEEDGESFTYHNPTLRLDLGSIIVLDIKGVQYEWDRLPVTRHCHTKDQQQDF